jgi:hypothetical protein
MHVLTDTKHTLYAGGQLLSALGATERTFDIDLINNTSRAAGPDGIADNSGTHFYNLSNLLNARDNLRQSVSDLLTLRRSISDITINAHPLNANNVGFVGLSLGAITGANYLAFEDEITPAALAAPGVGLSRLLSNSPSFGPIINAGLADKGAPKGSVEYEAFLTAAQTVIDPGDPVNHVIAAANKQPILLMEMVAGDGGSLADQVIPNFVATAPLSGTEPMIKLMGLTPITKSLGDGSAVVKGVARFTSGTHSSLLAPAIVPASNSSDGTENVTIEMQSLTAQYIKSEGKSIIISDPSLIKQN